MTGRETLILFIAYFLGCGVCFLASDHYYKEEAVARNCAEYDSKTGDFKWLNQIGDSDAE